MSLVRDKQWVIDNVLTAPEAAQYLGVSKQALHSATQRGRVEIIKDKLYLKEELNRYKDNPERIKHIGTSKEAE